MITKPTLLLDEQKCRDNIRMMTGKAEKSKVAFRPHFKTHQSLEIGRWFKESGVDKITVSSLEMAVYFAPEWNDITVAFPVNILEIETINYLAEKINLNLLIESVESASLYAASIAKYEVPKMLKTGEEIDGKFTVANLIKNKNKFKTPKQIVVDVNNKYPNIEQILY